MVAKNNKFITALFIFSLIYYTYDIFTLHFQYKSLLPKNKKKKNINGNNLYYYGFIIHHCLTIGGLSSILSSGYYGRVILLCFMLGESSNIPRLIFKVIERRNIEEEYIKNTLYTSYIMYRSLFVWSRLANIQITYFVIYPLLPFNISIFAILLIIFAFLTVIFEWRVTQNKLYSKQHSQFYGHDSHRVDRYNNSNNNNNIDNDNNNVSQNHIDNVGNHPSQSLYHRR